MTRKYNWVFTCNGIQKATQLRNMYLYKDKHYQKTTREKALSACKNEWEDYMNLAVDEIDLTIDGKKPEKKIFHVVAVTIWNYNGKIIHKT